MLKDSILGTVLLFFDIRCIDVWARFEVRKSVMSAKESSTFISVSVCYSLVYHAVVKVTIPGTIH